MHMATIQAVELPKPAMTSSIFSKPRTTAIVAPVRVVAIIGIGLVTQLAIVATKTANICQALLLIAAGLKGVKSQRARPRNKGIIQFFHFILVNIAGLRYLACLIALFTASSKARVVVEAPETASISVEFAATILAGNSLIATAPMPSVSWLSKTSTFSIFSSL